MRRGRYALASVPSRMAMAVKGAGGPVGTETRKMMLNESHARFLVRGNAVVKIVHWLAM